jgi:predicted nicotinamide N-methyase
MYWLPIIVATPFILLLGKIDGKDRYKSLLYGYASASTAASSIKELHYIDGIECCEITLNLPRIGDVTILEATAASQDELVIRAVELDDNMDNKTVTSIDSVPMHAGDIYGAVLWPAALTIASYILEHDNNELCIDHTILEVGTGTGLVSLAAALGGARKVIASDYESIPLMLLQAAAKLNHVSSERLITRLFDICDSEQQLPQATVVVAADVLYEPKTGRALARRAVEALRNGCHVIIGDSPGRPGRPSFLTELERLGIQNACFESVTGSTVTGARNDLICGPTSATRSEQPQELVVSVMHLDPRQYNNL